MTISSIPRVLELLRDYRNWPHFINWACCSTNGYLSGTDRTVRWCK